MATKPEDIVYRFCGYCGKSLCLNQDHFLMHVNECETTGTQPVKPKIGDVG